MFLFSPTKYNFIKAKYQRLSFVHRLPCRDDDTLTASDLSQVSENLTLNYLLSYHLKNKILKNSKIVLFLMFCFLLASKNKPTFYVYVNAGRLNYIK